MIWAHAGPIPRGTRAMRSPADLHPLHVHPRAGPNTPQTAVPVCRRKVIAQIQRQFRALKGRVLGHVQSPAYWLN